MIRAPVRWAGVGAAGRAPPSGLPTSWNPGPDPPASWILGFASVRPGTAAARTPRARVRVRICILERTRPRAGLFARDADRWTLLIAPRGTPRDQRTISIAARTTRSP